VRIGVPREVSPGESRVALAPHAVYELARAGHRVLVETGAGEASSIPDERYEEAGAILVGEAGRVYEDSELVVKVYGPTEEEYRYLREGLILFAFLSLPVNPGLMRALLDSRCVAFAMEAIRDHRGGLPVLAPMSEIAGRMAPQVGARLQEKASGGRGILLGGVSGVRPAKVLVLGAGMAGGNAAWIAVGMEAEVLVVDKNLDKLRFIDQIHKGRIVTLMSDRLTLEQRVRESDVVIGAVLVPGGKAPKLVTEDMIASMRPGSVVIDIAIDQGGCLETSRTTTHSDPTYVVHDVVHYCVGNMPGAVPNTSTYALTNVTLPYAVSIAETGLEDALRDDPALALGLNTHQGVLTNQAVAEAHGMESVPVSSVIRSVPG
jgi:alanine dehydrogenase